ncbi:MAG TPA: STAS domain-containing protein [Phycisphaerae bacterium]|nr:STAS domain-containing protein [Phycisphaerae bacterium]
MGEQDNPIRGVRWMGPDGKTVVVEANDEIDMHRSNEFQRELMKVLAEGPTQIVVDLSAVSYMDSSGVASLVKLLSRCSRQKIRLKLAGMTPRVRSIFEITKLDTVFEIVPGVKEAVES